ncbi:MAG: hypothetical protein WBM40_22045 [Thiohalocapsa sp.]
MFDFSPALRHAAAAGCIAGALLLVGGCASDSGGKPFSGMKNPLEGGFGNPFKRPTEAGFFALVRKNCAPYSIGGQGLGTLQPSDGGIGATTAKLDRGDVSNDEYINLLLQEHPAEDANVPATGCVINQLDTCLSTNCELTTSQSPEMQKADAMITADQQQAAEQVPVAERDAVDTMIDQADEANAGAAGDLSSEP